MIDLRQYQFLAGDVAEAAGLEPAALQNLLKRGKVGVSNPGSGGRRLFKGETVIQLAFAGELLQCGFGPNLATFAIDPMTRETDGQLRGYLADQTGDELFVFWLRGLEDRPTGSYFNLYPSGAAIDFSNWIDGGKSFHVLPVGIIAKRVIAKLEQVLAARAGDAS